MPVEVVPAKDVRTGGVFQLRQVRIRAFIITASLSSRGELVELSFKPLFQGQSRRIQVDVRSVQDSGTMPLIAEVVLAVSVGCVETRQSPAYNEQDEMDSYQVE